jgi:hypothetical protein
MKKDYLLLSFGIFAALLLSACQSTVPPSSSIATATPVPTDVTYTDPVTYCAAVGTIDAPDARYTGEAVPESVLTDYLKAAGLQNSTEPLDTLRAGTSWRCMNNQVYACNVGANLPCQSKANTATTPTQAMNDYCTANADAAFIPASVTGHETIYSWKCQGTTAVTDQQIDKADDAGFLASIWYALQ